MNNNEITGWAVVGVIYCEIAIALQWVARALIDMAEAVNQIAQFFLKKATKINNDIHQTK